ncbi:hypothetical protein GGX14DRAFT_467462 [Mycena pura]|uniref:F-box domain-containing protein n=1 Tax=Mycena pura TaxID=153505 RepID=A0AAD6V3L4_9AGAR|nr:hypothetical protein GGX14DRAFT_467462 [Mycena pura]
MQFDPHVQFDAPAVKCVQLPPEIQEIIMDLLSDDKDALRTCSFVDQAWLHLSRRHLFASVHLLKDRCESFRHLCHSPRGAVAPYISTLSISSPKDADYMNESASFFLDLVPYLPSLPALICLEISSLSWQDASQQCLSSMARCFSNLTELCIHLVEFSHSQQVLVLLSCFQMLEKLSIGATFATEDQASSSIPPPNLRHLRVLRLRVGLHGTGAFRDLISWFIPTNGFQPAIQALSIASLESSMVPVVGSLLRGLGSTLKHLDIWFMSSVTVADVNTHIDLTCNRGLRSVTVHSLDSKSWAVLEGISIDVLSVNIFVESMEALDRMEWARLSWTPRFAGLRRFSLAVICFTEMPGNNGRSLDADTVQGEIRRRVPEWAEQENTEIKLELKPILDFYDEVR